MQKKPRLSTLSLGLLAASFLMSSVTFAANYKNESYKGEAMPAAPVAPCKVLKDGFYVGAQVGYDSYRVRESVNAGAVAGTFWTGNPVINATGFAGGLLAGYGQYFSNYYYLGGELFINRTDADQSWNSTDVLGTVYSNKFTARTSYGVALLPGVKLNDSTLLYVRLGWNRADLKGQESLNLTSLGGPTASASNTSWESGFNYGLGLESVLVDNLSLRGEYSHTNYGSFKTHLFAGGAGTKFNAADNQYMLGLVYHF